MARNREEVTVHRMNPVDNKRPVFYASLPCGPPSAKTPEGQGMNGPETRHRLVTALWDHITALEIPLWRCCQASGSVADTIQVVSGLLGRPNLLVGGNRGPAVSFSNGGGNVWAALSGDESDIGIDVAGADEFGSEYPLHRVFHPEELHHAVRLTGGVPAEASALLWSVKEAAVKALGCAFHLVDPRQITVYPPEEAKGGWHTFPVRLSGKALLRFPLATGRPLRVCSLPQGNNWLSIALVNQSPTGHE